jgi:hypothetical protein
MIPYIAILILLIVVILYQVYAGSESFVSSKDASGNSVITRDASGNIIITSKDASGNTVTTQYTGRTASKATKDASGNEIKLSISDLFGLLGPFKMSDASGNSIKTAAPAETKPTESSTKEIEDRIAKAVSKQVKDDLMSQRAVDDIHDKYAPCDLTDSEAQGQEYQNVQPKPLMGLRNHQQPDMSEYIRKDSIPCWNCSVP